MDPYIKSFEIKESYLLIEVYGVRNNLLEVVNSTTRFTEIILKTKSKKILLDYRQVTFKINISDAFNIVRYYEKLPVLAEVKMAAVINTKTLPFAKAWKDVSLKRGFDLNYFLEFDKAVEWLASK